MIIQDSDYDDEYKDEDDDKDEDKNNKDDSSDDDGDEKDDSKEDKNPKIISFYTRTKIFKENKNITFYCAVENINKGSDLTIVFIQNYIIVFIQIYINYASRTIRRHRRHIIFTIIELEIVI